MIPSSPLSLHSFDYEESYVDMKSYHAMSCLLLPLDPHNYRLTSRKLSYSFIDTRRWKNKAETRRKIGMELWKMLSEEVPEGMTREEMWEDWGLEDEE